MRIGKRNYFKVIFGKIAEHELFFFTSGDADDTLRAYKGARAFASDTGGPTSLSVYERTAGVPLHVLEVGEVREPAADDLAA